MRNPIVMLNEAYKIVTKETSDLLKINPYSHYMRLSNDDYIKILGNAISYKIDCELTLLSMAIDIMIAEDTDIKMGVEDLKHLLHSSDLFTGTKIMAVNSSNRDSFINNSLNILLINLSNFINVKIFENWKFTNMDEVMIQCRALCIITYEKIENYIRSILR